MSEKFEVTNLDMKSGMTLKIKGKIHKDVNRFEINLGQDQDKLNLHFNPRFNESIIVFNSRNGGRWEQEQRESSTCFRPGEEVKITVAFHNNEFKVTLPDGNTMTFPNRLGQNHLSYLSMAGLQISSFKLK